MGVEGYGRKRRFGGERTLTRDWFLKVVYMDSEGGRLEKEKGLVRDRFTEESSRGTFRVS